MNKKIIIAGCLGLVLIIAAFFYVQHIEKNINQEISAALALHNVKAKHVEYSFLKDKLIIKDIEIKDFLLAESNLFIQELIAYSPNAEAFNLNAVGRPLVAKKISITGLDYTYKLLHLKQHIKVGTITTSNWKQNIAKLIELKKQGYNEAFFAALFDCTADEGIYTDYVEQGQTVADGITFDSIVKMDSFKIKNITPTNFESYTFDNVVSSLSLKQTEVVAFSIKNMAANNIPVPSPATVASIVKLYPNIMADNLTEDQDEEIAAQLAIIGKSLTKSSLNLKELKFKMLTAENDESHFNLQGFELASDIDKALKHIKLNAKVEGAAIDVDSLDFSAEETAQLAFLFGKTALLDISTSINLIDKNPSSLSLEFGVQNAMHLRTKFDAILPDETLPSIFDDAALAELDMDDLEGWLLKTKFVNVEKAYDDSGMLSKMLLLISQQQGQDPRYLWEISAPMLKQLIQVQLPLLKAKDVETIYQCIDNTGTLNINAKPTPPATLADIFKSLTANQDSIHITTTCTPKKKIVEGALELMPK